MSANQNQKSRMKHHSTWALAVAGAALVAASQAGAQVAYSPGDLLLNFRNPSATTGNDLEVDVGPVGNLTTEELVPSSLVEGEFGTIGTGVGDVSLGFSAAAAHAAGTDGDLWLTRVDTTPGAQPSVVSGQQTYSSQNPVAIRIGNMGSGYQAGTLVAGYNNATTVPGGLTDSYQTQGQQSSASPGVIDYNGFENVNASKGGNIESVQDGSGNVYEALWEVPSTTTSGGATTGAADTYLGYLTFQPNGEVDFTTSAVPEPSALELLVGTGVGAMALRRKFKFRF